MNAADRLVAGTDTLTRLQDLFAALCFDLSQQPIGVKQFARPAFGEPRCHGDRYELVPITYESALEKIGAE